MSVILDIPNQLHKTILFSLAFFISLNIYEGECLRWSHCRNRDLCYFNLSEMIRRILSSSWIKTLLL